MFEIASQFTFDPNIREILLNCARGKYPSQFKIVSNNIISQSGKQYPIPIDPIDLCNLVILILSGNEPNRIKHTPSSSVRRSIENQLDNLLLGYCDREMYRHRKDIRYRSMLYSCIQSAIISNIINANDIIMKNGYIVSISGIDHLLSDIESLI